MKLKILQVLNGDAITINFLGNDGKYHNIFIDGGFAVTYARTIKREAQEILNNGQKIDLFVITHIDQDHIGGAIKFIRDYKTQDKDIVSQYWFNYGELVFIQEDSDKISYSQGIELRDYLLNNGKNLSESIHEGIEPVNLFGVKITVLSPTIEGLEDFKKKWSSEEIKKKKKGLIAAHGDDYDSNVEKLADNSFKEDNSLTNKVSITFIFQHNDKSILFLADSYPSTVVNSLKKKGYSKENKLKVDYVKVSHHGSKFNTNFELLEIIDCTNFIISADAKNKHYHPHKEMLARILKNPERKPDETINFFFNYDNDKIRSIFKKSDLSHNFKCFYPKDDTNGYKIEF